MSTRSAAGQNPVPATGTDALLTIAGRKVQLSNLDKVFWPREGITKRALLQYYAAVAPVLIPHLKDRAMVMKRYPNGIDAPYFFMKRAPSPRPEWIELCSIEHGSGSVIGFPMINDLASLLWVVNLGCVDLNQWYARCDDIDRPDYLHFDVDPGAAPFERVVEVALILHEALDALELPNYVKTSGSKGAHVYVPIVRGPLQKQVWTFAKALALELARQHPALITAEYRIAKRPPGRVLIDYNQNRWGATLASVYSVRPQPRASVSTPLRWEELTSVAIEDFRIDNVPARIALLGDLWKPLVAHAGRAQMERFL